MKNEEKKRAIQLRRKGQLYSEIATKLNISPSTAKLWTQDLILNEAEDLRLTKRQHLLKLRRVQELNIRRKRLREDDLTKQRAYARTIVKSVKHSQEYRQLLCSVLYWCEGTKDTSSGIKFTNSDPALIRSFLSLLRTSFTIEEDKFRILMHLHTYHNEAQQRQFWSRVTNVPPQQFHKSYIKPNTGTRRKLDYPGTISLRYLDSGLGKLLKMIYSEYGRM